MNNSKLGRVAFITTPEYRMQSPDKIADFVYRHLYSLSHADRKFKRGGPPIRCHINALYVNLRVGRPGARRI